MHPRLSWLSSFAVLATLLLALPTAALAQDKFQVKAEFSPATAKPGDEVTLRIHATVEYGWHAYGTKEQNQIPVSLPAKKLVLSGLEVVEPAVIPEGTPSQGPLGTQYELPHEFTVDQKLRVPKGMAGGKVKVSGELKYQICDANSCEPPDAAKFSATLTVDAAASQQGGEQGGAQAAVPELGVVPGLQLVPDEKLTLKARFEPATARAGETVMLVLDAEVIDGWHAYGTLETTNLPVSLKPEKLTLGVLERGGEPQIPAGELKDFHGLDTYPLPHQFTVKQPVKVPEGTAPGEVEVSGAMNYQVCDENSCDGETDAAFTARLVIEAGAARAEYMAAAAAEPRAGGPRQPKYTLDDIDGDNALTGSIWSLILLSIAGGLFALVMPCTYPMIPITFSFFTKQADRRNGNVLSLALTYGIGIVLMFTIIGVAAGGAIIPFAGHWATNLVIGVAFVVFAFSLFGFFTLQLPAFVTNAAGRASAAGGLLGVFLMGATLVVTSFTCTAPIVGALLAGVAEGGYGRVALGMAVFGLTMAAPFVFLALLPGRVKALPKSGEWMNTLKVSLGFVELAAALKFFSNVELARGWHVLPREAFLMIWAFAFTALALYLFGLLGHRRVPVEGVSATRNSVGLASLAFAFYCLFGVMGFNLDPIMTAFEPPYRLRQIEEHEIVKDDYAQAMELAKREKKYVLVNFTGFT